MCTFLFVEWLTYTRLQNVLLQMHKKWKQKWNNSEDLRILKGSYGPEHDSLVLKGYMWNLLQKQAAQLKAPLLLFPCQWW